MSVAPSGSNHDETLLAGLGLYRRFGTTAALNGASIEVKAGEIVAVMGPSGSGKSTLLHCLSCIIRPHAGEVHYEGRRLDGLSEDARSRLRREEFGFVFQFGQLVPDLSSLENVTLPLRLDGVRRTVAERQARDWLARLEVDDVGDKRPGEISGGQGQRVAVARALINSPRVIFADEPTGSLDSLQGEVVMGLLVAAARDEGAAVILVTHDPTVAAYAEREVIVRDGRTSSPALAP